MENAAVISRLDTPCTNFSFGLKLLMAGSPGSVHRQAVIL
jgi:hypothetical protein